MPRLLRDAEFFLTQVCDEMQGWNKTMPTLLWTRMSICRTYSLSTTSNGMQQTTSMRQARTAASTEKSSQQRLEAGHDKVIEPTPFALLVA